MFKLGGKVRVFFLLEVIFLSITKGDVMSFNRKLIVIDFDKTIVDGHTYQTITKDMTSIAELKAFYEDKNQKYTAAVKAKHWNDVKDFKPLKPDNNKTWKQVIEELLKEGHDVAIASFTPLGIFIKHCAMLLTQIQA